MRKYELNEGMYCSRKFARWMIRKNEQDTDIPVKSYHKLVKMYCRANYYEFFTEEERKGNEFYYTLFQEGNMIWLKSTYDLVYLSYKDGINEFPVENLENVEEFVPGYRILQTRGYMPGSTQKAFEENDYFSMESLVTQVTSGLRGETVKIRPRCIDDIFRAKEFQEAEMKDFIDNNPPCSFGPECPDKIICYQMFNRIIKNLMNELERLNIVGDKESKTYELRLISYATAIISMVLPEDYKLSQGLLIDDIKEKADQFFESYCLDKSENTLEEVGHKINEGRWTDLRVIVDRADVLECDYDFYDMDDAPIGLTGEDIERFDDFEPVADGLI